MRFSMRARRVVGTVAAIGSLLCTFAAVASAGERSFKLNVPHGNASGLVKWTPVTYYGSRTNRVDVSGTICHTNTIHRKASTVLFAHVRYADGRRAQINVAVAMRDFKKPCQPYAERFWAHGVWVKLCAFDDLDLNRSRTCTSWK